LDGDKAEYRHAYFTVHAKKIEKSGNTHQAKIGEAWVYHGDDINPICHKGSPYQELAGYDQYTQLVPEHQIFSWDLPNDRCLKPLVIRTKIKFGEPGEEIWIQAAGALIEER